MSNNDFYDPLSVLMSDASSASAGQSPTRLPQLAPSPRHLRRPVGDVSFAGSAAQAPPGRQAAIGAAQSSSQHSPAASLPHPPSSHLPNPPPPSPPIRYPPDFWDQIYEPPPSRGPSRWGPASNFDSHPAAGRGHGLQSPSLTSAHTSQTSFQTTTDLPFSYSIDFDSSRSNSPTAMPRRDRVSSAVETNARNRPAVSHKRLQRPEGESESSGTNKRARQHAGDSSGSRRRGSSGPEIIDIDAVDEGDAMEQTLARQRQEQVRAAATGEQGDDERRFLTKMTCVICLESPTYLTATNCGHLFCHECITQSLIHAENRPRQNGEPKRAQCPVCRKTINRHKDRELIPLLLKKGLATQPRKSKNAR